MAVVHIKSDLTATAASPASAAVPDPARARGRIVVAAGTVTHSATDTAASIYHLADIPADAILDKSTAFKTDTWNMGANVGIGTKTDNDALFTGAKGAALAPVAFGDAKHGLPLWQVLGLAAAPESNVIGIYLHGLANATLAGSAKFEIAYRYH